MLVHSADEMRPLQNGVTLASFRGGGGGGCDSACNDAQKHPNKTLLLGISKDGNGSQIGADRNTLLAGSISWVSPLKLYLRDGGREGGRKMERKK